MQNILLYGMRGTGKSSIGKILSKEIGSLFIDLDKVIEEKSEIKINEMVEKYGWDYFRDLENESLKEVINIPGKKVISLGGGTIIFERNRVEIKKLKEKELIFIESDLSEIAKRIEKNEKSGDSRPSLSGKSVLEELEEIYKIREDIYKKNADKIIENNGKIEECVEKIKRYINKKKICVPVVDFDFLKKNNLEKGSPSKPLCQGEKYLDERILFVEFRIDYLFQDYEDFVEKDVETKKILSLQKEIDKKIIITLRTKKEGGNFIGSPEEIIKIQKYFLENGCDLIDMELDVLESNNVGNGFKPFPTDNLIISHHNFEKTYSLEKMKEILERMKKYKPRIYKIAMMPNNEKDVERMYELVEYFKKNFIGKDFIFISMGELGQETRIKIPQIGGYLTFGSNVGNGFKPFPTETKSAPGQIPYKELYDLI